MYYPLYIFLKEKKSTADCLITQGHHKYPYTITRRQVCNNLHALARSVAFVVPLIDFMVGDNASTHAFIGACAGCIMLSQQFHAWAHEKKRKLPPIVAALQEAGVLVSRTEHAAHHQSPYNSNYCIVSGAWNEFLDELKVFETLEMVLFFKLGVRPRSWSEPEKEWKVAQDEGIGQDYYSFEK
jgi:palmitoyl-[glycerolipid] 3-(E)-desaturase